MDLTPPSPSTRPPGADIALGASAQYSLATPVAQAETARPVVAPAAPSLPGPIKGLGIAPLETSMVGDDDDVPVPPEPPRPDRLTARASLELAALPQPEASSFANKGQTAQDAAPETPPAVSPTTPASANLGTALRDIDEGPRNPTVDLRS